MDSHGLASEVEKPKPFADRAQKCLMRIDEQKRALLTLFCAGYRDYLPVLMTLLKTSDRAADLINEAVRRGVKGKDIGK